MKTQNQKNESNFENEFKIKNDRIWLAFIHLSGIIPLFFSTILIYKRKKATIKEMPEHFWAAITFQSSVFFIWFLGFLGFIVSSNSTLHFGILILNAVFSILNANRFFNKKTFRYPFQFWFNRKKVNLKSI